MEHMSLVSSSHLQLMPSISLHPENVVATVVVVVVVVVVVEVVVDVVTSESNEKCDIKLAAFPLSMYDFLVSSPKSMTSRIDSKCFH